MRVISSLSMKPRFLMFWLLCRLSAHTLQYWYLILLLVGSSSLNKNIQAIHCYKLCYKIWFFLFTNKTTSHTMMIGIHTGSVHNKYVYVKRSIPAFPAYIEYMTLNGAVWHLPDIQQTTVILVASFIKVKLYDHSHRPEKSIKQTNGQARQFCAGSGLTWKMYLSDVSTLFNSFPWEIWRISAKIWKHHSCSNLYN